MKTRTLLLAGMVVAAVVWGVVIVANPLRRSEKEISTWLQAQTPLGSSCDSVIAYAKEKRWNYSHNHGSDGNTKGEFVRGELGEYRNLFVTSVTVFWEFDSASRLERIRVWKTVDAL